MKIFLSKILPLILFIQTNLAFTQEWKNLKTYQKETKNIILENGCWLKNDRIKQTFTWSQANSYNLNSENGNKKYKTISQIRDFYLWFDRVRIQRGHEIKWIGFAAIAATELAKLDNSFIRIFIVRNKDIVKFGREGSIKVFDFTFPKLKKLYFSDKLITGKDAENWDKEHGMKEQCKILDSLYKNLSEKDFHKLERMAKGKGIFSLGVPKKLRFEGDLHDCKARIDYGISKILPVYLNK
ncbi:MAG: hypothetical protein Q8K04_04605 [Lutibacter sp.]|jgi:hypothetical protein|nr:hypothetical protein [Lutibacter sp.]